MSESSLTVLTEVYISCLHCFCYCQRALALCLLRFTFPVYISSVTIKELCNCAYWVSHLMSTLLLLLSTSSITVLTRGHVSHLHCLRFCQRAFPSSFLGYAPRILSTLTLVLSVCSTTELTEVHADSTVLLPPLLSESSTTKCSGTHFCYKALLFGFLVLPVIEPKINTIVCANILKNHLNCFRMTVIIHVFWPEAGSCAKSSCLMTNSLFLPSQRSSPDDVRENVRSFLSFHLYHHPLSQSVQNMITKHKHNFERFLQNYTKRDAFYTIGKGMKVKSTHLHQNG